MTTFIPVSDNSRCKFYFNLNTISLTETVGIPELIGEILPEHTVVVNGITFWTLKLISAHSFPFAMINSNEWKIKTEFEDDDPDRFKSEESDRLYSS